MTRRTVRIDDDDWKNQEIKSKKLGFTSNAEYIRQLVKNDLNGNSNSELTVKQQIEIAKRDLILKKNEIAVQDIRIKTSYADFVAKYVETFGNYPSPQALRSMSAKSKNDNIIKVSDTPIQKEEFIPKFATTYSEGKFFGLCKLCHESDFESIKEDFLVEKLEDHIKEQHGTEPYTRVIVN